VRIERIISQLQRDDAKLPPAELTN
jgi:hypothetical protein